MTAALMLTAMTKVQAQNFEGPCLPYAHGLNGHQSAFCGSTETQTIELAAGWNWISTYIEGDPFELLDMLKESLGDKGLVIKSVDLITMYEDEEWFGDLDDEGMYNEQMYMVNVSEDCQVVLQGTPANPADHGITIKRGWNWIGFPYDQELSIEEALADFEAEEGDALKSASTITVFEDDEWFGDLETLVPGGGYMYYYNGTEPQTLIFSTGAKAKRGVNRVIPINLKKLTTKPNDFKQVKLAEIFEDRVSKSVSKANVSKAKKSN